MTGELGSGGTYLQVDPSSELGKGNLGFSITKDITCTITCHCHENTCLLGINLC